MRVQSVTDPGVAREWLEMQQFDMLLVDGALSVDSQLDIVRHGWAHNGLLIGGIFHFSGPRKPQTAPKTPSAYRKFPESTCHVMYFPLDL